MTTRVRDEGRRSLGGGRARAAWRSAAVVVVLLLASMVMPWSAQAAPGDTQVTVSLDDSAGNPLDGGVVSYYSSGWHTLPDPTSGGVTTVELPPGTYSFAMVYNGTRVQRNGVVVSGSTTDVPFQTTRVTASLTDSNGDPLDGGSASYYASSWHTIGTTVSGVISVEMLQGPYSFAMVYNGTRVQRDAVVIAGATTDVPFQTAQVTVSLRRSLDDAPVSGGQASYYASGWRAVGTTPASGSVSAQMLPGTYPFSMAYHGTTQQQTATIAAGTANLVAFYTDLFAPTITSGAPPAATSGEAYSFTITATGNPAPRFTISAGTLPDGLSLDPTTGQITGTPTRAGEFTFTITASNDIDPDATATYTLHVRTAPVTPPGPSLPATGGRDLQAIGSAGAIALLAGLALLMVGRRRMRL